MGDKCGLLLVAFLGSGCLVVVSDQPLVTSTTTGGMPTGGPQVSCVPSYDTFIPTADGTSSSVPIYCSNLGSSVSGVNLMIEIEGTGSSVFTAQFGPGGFPVGGLVPNQTVEILTTYTPLGISQDVGTLTLSTNVGNVQIPMFGDGINATCELKIPTQALNFGNVPQGTTSAPLPFAIDNIGSSLCEIQGPFAIHNDPTHSYQLLSTSIQPSGATKDYLIPPNSSLDVDVTFTPSTTGQLGGQVADFITLSGSGTTP